MSKVLPKKLLFSVLKKVGQKVAIQRQLSNSSPTELCKTPLPKQLPALQNQPTHNPNVLPTHGPPTHSQPTHSQPTHGQPTHGAPTHGAPTYGPPTHGPPTLQPRPVGPIHQMPRNTSPSPMSNPSHQNPANPSVPLLRKMLPNERADKSRNILNLGTKIGIPMKPKFTK
jgi:hypothetical protein